MLRGLTGSLLRRGIRKQDVASRKENQIMCTNLELKSYYTALISVIQQRIKIGWMEGVRFFVVSELRWCRTVVSDGVVWVCGLAREEQPQSGCNCVRANVFISGAMHNLFLSRAAGSVHHCSHSPTPEQLSQEAMHAVLLVTCQEHRASRVQDAKCRPDNDIWPAEVTKRIKTLKNSVFWDITPCSPLKVIRRFGRTCLLHLQRLRISQAINQHESRWHALVDF
jgi:hypothetical protein